MSVTATVDLVFRDLPDSGLVAKARDAVCMGAHVSWRPLEPGGPELYVRLRQRESQEAQQFLREVVDWLVR
jgi:hypothetical protein